MKIDIEAVKVYKSVCRQGKLFCYVCGEVEPKCGFYPMIQLNLPPDALSDEICNDCYKAEMNGLAKKGKGQVHEAVWGLK